MTELKDWLKSINQTKEDLSENIKSYPPFIINKCLSGEIDSLMYANEININHHLDKKLQYDFYVSTLRKRNRFSAWIYKEKFEDLDCIKKYYGYSNEKASQVLKILNRDQIAFIKSKLETGGPK